MAPKQVAVILTPEGERWAKVSDARIRKKLGLNDPNVDSEEIAQRLEEFGKCMSDEFLFRGPEGTDGPTAGDYLDLPWGVENLDKFMPIEDWCVGEVTGNPRMANGRALRAEFRKDVRRWMERQIQRNAKDLPDDPNDPRPRMEPQAPKVVEMRLEGARHIKQNTFSSASKLDTDRARLKDMAYRLSKANAGRVVQGIVQGAPEAIKNAALTMTTNAANGKGSSPWKMPALNVVRGGPHGAAPLFRIPV